MRIKVGPKLCVALALQCIRKGGPVFCSPLLNGKKFLTVWSVEVGFVQKGKAKNLAFIFFTLSV